MARPKKSKKKADDAEQLDTAQEMELGYKAYGLDDELRGVNVMAIKHFAAEIEKSKKKDETLGINTSEHKKLLRLLTGSDTRRGLLQIFETHANQQQTDLVYDEQVPLDTEIRDALAQIEVTGTDLHLIATLSPEQKRATMEWVKAVMEAQLNNHDTQPGMPAWIPELFPKVDNADPLLEGVDEKVRDEFVAALDVALGKSPFVSNGVSENSEIETAVAFRFEELAQQTPAGFFNHTTAGGTKILCNVGGGAAPLFAYGVDQKSFDPSQGDLEAQSLAYATGDRLVALARRLWKVDAEAPEQPTGEEITMGAPAATEDAPDGIQDDEVGSAVAGDVPPTESTGDDGFGEVEAIPPASPEVRETIEKVHESQSKPQMELVK